MFILPSVHEVWYMCKVWMTNEVAKISQLNTQLVPKLHGGSSHVKSVFFL